MRIARGQTGPVAWFFVIVVAAGCNAPRCAAARLDRELAAGISPEASAILAARAMQLTSMKVRRDLAASVQRIIAVAAPAAVISAQGGAARPPRLPVNRARISQSALPLAGLAGLLAGPGPVRVQGVAMVSLLLADGTGRFTALPAVLI